MKQVLVRGVEPELLERLKAIAKRRGRSLQAELREMMATHAAMHDRSRAAAEATRIRAAISNWITTDADIDRTCAALAAARQAVG